MYEMRCCHEKSRYDRYHNVDMVDILVLINTDSFSEVASIIYTIKDTESSSSRGNLLIFNTTTALLLLLLLLLASLSLHQSGANPYNRLGLWLGCVCW